MNASSHVVLIKEVAFMLGLSVSSINVRLRQARLGESRFPLTISEPGTKCRWLRSDIERYIESQSQANNAAPPVNPVSPAKRQRESQSLQRRGELAQAVLAKHAAGRRKPK